VGGGGGGGGTINIRIDAITIVQSIYSYEPIDLVEIVSFVRLNSRTIKSKCMRQRKCKYRSTTHLVKLRRCMWPTKMQKPQHTSISISIKQLSIETKATGKDVESWTEEYAETNY